MTETAHHYTILRMTGRYAVCRLAAQSPLPTWATQGEFWSVTRTRDELSVVCHQELMPPGITATPEWTLFQVAGPFDFSVTGVLAALSTTLAQAGVVLLALATYDTDYLLVKADQAEAATVALAAQGHQIIIAASTSDAAGTTPLLAG